MIRFVIAWSSLLLGVELACAQQDIATMREALMKENGRNMYRILSPMVRETKPYNQIAVDAAFSQFEETAAKLPTLYPDSSKSVKSGNSEYAPSAKIWESRADFESHIASWTRIINDFKGKIDSLEALKAAYPILNNQCTNCHETYRERTG